MGNDVDAKPNPNAGHDNADDAVASRGGNPAEHKSNESSSTQEDPAETSTKTSSRVQFSAPKLIFFSFFMAFLVFAIPEGILTLLDLPKVTPLNRDGTIDIFWGLTPNLKNKPFLHKELGTYFKVSTNSHSMRYREIPTGRQENTIRIMALGDSTTFGWGVENDETYPARLEALLKEKYPNENIEVIDGGVPGYTSFQGLNHYKVNAGRYEPDIILFGYIVQDARKVAVTDKQQAIEAAGVGYLADSPLYKLRLVRYLAQRYEFIRSWLHNDDAKGKKDKKGGVYRVPLDEYRENIELFVKYANKTRSRLILFGFPLEVVGYTKAHRELLKKSAEELHLDHFDPSAYIAEAARRKTLYFPKDKGHPNAAGCQVIAEQVEKYLDESGILARTIAARK